MTSGVDVENLNSTKNNVLNGTQNGANSTAIADDKNFWEWLTGFISAGNPATTTEPPIPVKPHSCLPCSELLFFVHISLF